MGDGSINTTLVSNNSMVNSSSVIITTEEEEDKERVYYLKKISGGGCPYTASWLIHINLYRKVPWWIDITKMEAASFNM